jgi:hypothetical protein
MTPGKMITLYNTSNLIPITHYETNSRNIRKDKPNTYYYDTRIRTILQSCGQDYLFKDCVTS